MPTTEKQVVLVAEDDPNLVPFLRHHLDQQGYQPIVVETGAEVLRLALTAHPAVIVLDVGLPDMNGLDICKAMKQDRRTAEIPILFLTGHDDISDRVRGLDAGAQDYLVKPFAIPEFEARIRAILRKEGEVTREKDEVAQRQEELRGIIHHELRTPLTVISMASEILAQQHDLSATRREQLVQSIRGSAGMLAQIVEDLGFLANPIPHGRLSAIRTLTQSVVEEERQHVQGFDLHIVARVPAHFPAIELDEDQYRRALAHLIDNAVKFTNRGGIITVTLSEVRPAAMPTIGDQPGDLPPGLIPEETKESWAVIEVKDTGIGIAPEHHRRVFEPFYQIDSSSTRAAQGLGLGLAVVAAFVRAHHGQLAVRSGHGMGTAIHLAIPFHQNDLATPADGDDPASA